MQRPLLGFVVFVAILSAIVGGLHYYIWARLVRAPELPATWQRAGTIAVIALAALIPVGIFLSRALPQPAAGVLAMVVYGWFGFAVLLFFLLVTSDLLRASVLIGWKLAGTPVDAERRAFLARLLAGVVGGLALGAGAFGIASALGKVSVQRVRVALRRLPPELAGYRLVQITDLHVGPTIGRAYVGSVVEQINALSPHAVVITGDLVDGSVERLRDEVAPLAEIRARDGVFFVTGNHEYYSGVDEWMEHLGTLGIKVLHNERVTLGEGDRTFDLAGVPDWSARRGGDPRQTPDLAHALAGRDPARELVLLAHQPKQIVEAAAAGVGLMLSGHTHGGQIFPWGLLVRLDQPFVAGLDRLGDTQIYVSRGTGYWGPPMRVAAPSEITLLELEPGGAAA
ncbi:MAG: metallophosphoesterase [Polyangiaceae bacterium]